MNNLTDLDICRRVAKIEGEYNKYDDHSTNHSGVLIFGDGANWYSYNPLTDDALCFQLQNQYEVCVHYGCGDVFICGDDNFDGCLSVKSFDVDDKKTLNKAICLAIIEAHKELLP